MAESTELQTQQSANSAPQWHRRPTGPGLWLTFGRKPWAWSFVGLRLDESDIERGAPFETVAVYGPIPEMPVWFATAGKTAD